VYGGVSCQGRIKGNECGISLLPPVRLSRSCGEPPFFLEQWASENAHHSLSKKTKFSCSSQDCQNDAKSPSRVSSRFKSGNVVSPEVNS
jgi:hypothetical protein